MTVIDAIILLQKLPPNHELLFDVSDTLSDKFEGWPVDRINLAEDENGDEIVLMQSDLRVLPFSNN